VPCFFAQQVTSITPFQIYADGVGLYLRIRSSGRSWVFVGTLKPRGQRKIKGAGSGKRIELGLGIGRRTATDGEATLRWESASRKSCQAVRCQSIG